MKMIFIINVEQIVEILLRPAFARTHLLMIVLNLSLSGFVFYSSRFGSTTLLVSDLICNVQKSWRS